MGSTLESVTIEQTSLMFIDFTPPRLTDYDTVLAILAEDCLRFLPRAQEAPVFSS